MEGGWAVITMKIVLKCYMLSHYSLCSVADSVTDTTFPTVQHIQLVEAQAPTDGRTNEGAGRRIDLQTEKAKLVHCVHTGLTDLCSYAKTIVGSTYFTSEK
ncbi:hypothetical protein DPMN_145699 [Dreissena polymorpha]|uniref:Uncharacterized protein n=1 Tax=Dreissena polymorpha TaxID=45954 RepID=A0A9D4F797_DREPO|nr:hypothetical protein DPMN_145699 [Dreissena polymorpha]